MADSTTDRNLLFGMMALQNDMVLQDQLIEAFQIWILNKSRSVSTILEEKGWIESDDANQIQKLLERRIVKAGGEPNLIQQYQVVQDIYATLSCVPDSELQNMISKVMGDGGKRFGLKSSLEENQTVDYQAGPADKRNESDSKRLSQAGDEPSQAKDRKSSSSRFTASQFHAAGAMGKVYRAEDQEITRQVALKVMIEQSYRKNQESEFWLEGEVTGRLEHPGVVSVYGLGRTEDGKPYYAMKFVDSPTLEKLIKDYHRAESLPTRDASLSNQEFRKLLDHFRAACMTIQYAHDRGVLHCDVKPANIMTGEYGETFVIDWGMVILSQADANFSSTIGFGSKDPIHPTTAYKKALHIDQGGERVHVGGTPGYMAPEHYGCHNNGTISGMTTACDIFSLGANLYHILTGVPAVEAIKSESSDIKKTRILEGRFEKPSFVNSKVSLALEAICMKAMSAKPGQRYDSAKALSEDIARWMADEPVTAYREPIADRARRWARKNRTAMRVTAASMLVISIGAILYSLMQWRYNLELAQKNLVIVEERQKAQDNEAEAKLQKSKAEENALEAGIQKNNADISAASAIAAANSARENQETAEFTARFMVDLFKAADPVGITEVQIFRNIGAKQSDLRVKDILNQGRKRVEKEFKSKPLIRAQILSAIGQSYREISDYATAEKLLIENLQIVKEKDPANSERLTEAYSNLGQLYQYWGKYDQGEPYYLKALETSKKITGENGDTRRAKTHFFIGWHYADQIDSKKAEDHFRKAIAIFKGILEKSKSPEIERELLISKLGLVACMYDSGRLNQAESDFKNIGDEVKRNLNEENIESVISFQQGLFLGILELYESAEFQYRECIKHAEKGIGLDHPYVTFAYFQLASCLAEQGKLVEAEIYHKKCLDLLKSTVSLLQPRAIYVVRAYAELLVRLDRNKDADALYEEIIKARKVAFGENHIRVADAYAAQALHHFDQSKNQTGDVLLKQAVDIYERNPEKWSFILDVVYQKYAWRFYDRSEYTRAIAYFEKTIRLLRDHHTGGEEMELEMMDGIASSKAMLGDFAESMKQSNENLALARQSEIKSQEPMVLSTIGLNYKEQGMWQEALDSFTKSYALSSSTKGATGKDTLSKLEQMALSDIEEMALLNSDLGSNKSAVDQWNQLIELKRSIPNKSNKPKEEMFLGNRVILLLENKELSKAQEQLTSLLGNIKPDSSIEFSMSVLRAIALMPASLSTTDKKQTEAVLMKFESLDKTKIGNWQKVLVALGWLRLGEIGKSQNWLDTIKPVPGSSEEAFLWLAQGMRFKKMGDLDKSKPLLDKSKIWFTKNALAKTEKGQMKHDWNQRIAFRLLLQEVETKNGL